MDSDWKNLPEHLLALTYEEKLESQKDYVQFGATCDPWYSSAKYFGNQRANKVPMLLLPNIEEEHTLNIYDVVDRKFLKATLSIPYSKRFCGSSQGWLVSVDENLEVTLYKPFSMVKGCRVSKKEVIIRLPILLPFNEDYYHIHDYHILKATMTTNPHENPEDCILVVIYNGDLRELAYIKVATDKKWTRVDMHNEEWTMFDDVLHYKARFYAVTSSGKLISFSVTDSSDFDVKLIANEPPKEEEVDYDNGREKVDPDDDSDEDDSDEDRCRFGYTTKRYLVETHGRELWHIVRYFCWDNTEYGDRATEKFKIYKLDFSGPRWVEILESFGGISLFLGDNSSVSVVCPEYSACRPNCIYFTHDFDTIEYGTYNLSDLGVYDAKSGVIDLHHIIDPSLIEYMSKQPPIWVVPTIEY